jgi:hypothetical protein
MQNFQTITPGARKIVALVDEKYDFVTCEYKIYKDKKIEATVPGYGMLLLHLTRNGYLIDEVEYAVVQMQKNLHDTAHFGIFGTFMFTTDTLEDHEGIVS